MAYIQTIIYIVGLLTLSLAGLKAVNWISIYTLPSRLRIYAHISPNGDAPWALVTGASDGIGRAFASELATQGFNVVLHGRNHAKLTVVASDFRKRYPARSFRILVADASAVPGVNYNGVERPLQPVDSSQAPPDFASIQAELRDLHLTVVINNAGGGPTNPVFSPLVDCSTDRIASNVSLNALFPLHLTRVLLPVLRQNAPALVMNISSMADEGFPLLASYSASKQFLMTMTRAVGLELKLDDDSSNVELLGVRIGRVTNVSHLKEAPSLFTPDSQTMARAALARTGRGHGIVVGYWGHALQQASSSFLPRWAKDQVMMAIMREQRAGELRKQ
ncbi:short chain dehydrogenase [Colletotrichum paranaense]|uniref:Short chain dehydrogenase n=1 Tax=Colletotrichum paranaense TaxID=1914294 RepID=A0ABQ9SWA3_9PEZI|nr:short chain dehydrogenase [Colletotrichum paranaense]KAK1543788.1 short chain dehydrogenase [Colletotrichum paranaense]